MSYQYQGESVELEQWAWVAFYNDGTKLFQFDDETKEFHRIGEVDQSKLAVFSIYNTADPSQSLDLIIPEGARIIHKYRNYRPDIANQPELNHRIYIVGWKLGKSYLFHFILPNGRILTTNTEEVNLKQFM